MADLYKCEFDGVTMLSASEGEYMPQVQVIGTRVTFEDQPVGAARKIGCRGTAEHKLTLFFATTTTTAATVWANVYNRLYTLWDGREGILKIPDFPNLNKCTITNIDISEQTRIVQATPLNSGSTGFTTGVFVSAVLTFVQRP
jgi:hypothetical protein